MGTTDLGLSRISNKFNAARHGSAPGDNGCNIIFQVSTAGFVHDYNLWIKLAGYLSHLFWEKLLLGMYGGDIKQYVEK